MFGEKKIIPGLYVTRGVRSKIWCRDRENTIVPASGGLYLKPDAKSLIRSDW